MSQANVDPYVFTESLTMTIQSSVKSRPGKLREIPIKAMNILRENQACFAEDPNFYWMKTLARFEFVRDWATREKGDQAQPGTPSSTILSTDDSFEVACQTLQQEGYYQGLRLSPEILTAFLQFTETVPCYANRDPQLQFAIQEREALEAKLGKPILLASYFNAHESFEPFQALKADPLLLAIAASYLGREPLYHRGEIAWSFPAPATEAEKLAAAQVIHCDINDYKTVKFFFYLSDVDLGCGPHVYLKGTHRNRKLHHQWLGQRCASIPDETLIATYGEETVTTVCGSAGLGFVGDPYTFHQGTTPTHKPRLLMQLEYGVNTYKTWHFDTTYTATTN